MTTQPMSTMLPMMKAGRRTSWRKVSRRAWERSETAGPADRGGGLGRDQDVHQRSASSRMRGFIQAMIMSAASVASM